MRSKVLEYIYYSAWVLLIDELPTSEFHYEYQKMIFLGLHEYLEKIGCDGQ